MAARPRGRFLVGALTCACLAAGWCAPARAATPWSVRADGGVGWASGHAEPERVSGVGLLGSVDVLWRSRPTRAWLLSARGGAVEDCIACSRPLRFAPELGRPTLTTLEFWSLLVGVERHRPAGVTPFVAGGIGVGWLDPEGRSVRAEAGVALDGVAGWRIAPDPGPVGFVVALRSHNVFAANGRAHAVALALGLTVHPR